MSDIWNQDIDSDNDSQMLEQEVKEQETSLMTRKRSNSLSQVDQKKLLSEQEGKVVFTNLKVKEDKFTVTKQVSEEKTVDSTVNDSAKSTEGKSPVTEKKPVEESSITERPSLIASAKWYEKLWFSWAFPIIKKAGEKKLTIEELGGLREEDLIENKLVKVEEIYEAQTKKNILFACLIAFKRDYLQSLFTQILQCTCDLGQPYILKEIVRLLVSTDFENDTNEQIIFWAVALVAGRFIKYLIDEHDFYHNLKTGCTTSKVISSMVFKKQLSLTPATSKNYESGQVNSVKGAAHRLTWFSWEMAGFIKTPIIFLLVLFRLTVTMGWSFVPSILMMIACLQLDIYLHKFIEHIHKDRQKINEKLENATNDTFNNIKALKFYCWDEHFEKEILEKKAEELKKSKETERYYLLFTLMWVFLPQMMSSTAFTIYMGRGFHLDLPLAMEIMALIDHIRGPICHLTHLRRQVSDISISLQKVQNYLGLEEVQLDKFVEQTPVTAETDYAIEIDSHSFSWGLKTVDIDDMFDKMWRDMSGVAEKTKTKEEQEEFEKKQKAKAEEKKKQSKLDNIVTLKQIDLKIKKGELVFVIGKVGSGKSTLLSAIIGDLLPIPQKQIDHYARGEGLERELSQEEVEAFQSDLVMQQHDKYFKPAIKVSGSVSLAQQKPWIQNKTLRDNILYNKELNHDQYVDTIQFCELERDLEIMNAGDLSEIGEKGINLSGGQQARLGLARAVYQDKDIFLLDDPISALDAHVRKNIMNNVVNGMLKEKTRILVTHAIDFIHMADKIVIMDKGAIVAQGSYDELLQNPIFQKLQAINEINIDCTKKDESKEEDSQSDKKSSSSKKSKASAPAESEKSEDVKEDAVFPSPLSLQEKEALFETFGKEEKKDEGKIIQDENDEVIEVTWDTYKQVFKYYGHWSQFVVMFMIVAVVKYLEAQYAYVIAEWANSAKEIQLTDYYLYTFRMAKIVLGITAGHCIRQYIVRCLVSNTMERVHKEVLTKIIRAPVNKFFDVTPTGSILNRFNGDMGHFEHIIHAFIHGMYQLMHLVMIIYTILNAAPQVLMIVPVLLAYCIYIYKFTIGSMKEIHRVLRVTGSPINNHYSETQSGNSTIRAFGSKKFSIKKDHENNNKNLLAQQVSFATWVWYSAQMKISSSVLMVITAILCVQNRQTTDTIFLSVAFQWVMSLGDLMTGFLHNLGNTESKMVSIKRCLKLLEIPQENFDQPRHEDKSWPQAGEIEIKDVELRYRPTTDLVLKGCSMKIKAGDKVGVVGRTGAGKSTLSLALTRIVEKEAGQILVDGVDINEINLRQVRENITIIPQEPTMYKGSLKYNIDPSGKTDEAEILSVLKKAGLDEIILKKKKEEVEKKKKEQKDKTEEEKDEEETEDNSLMNFEISDNLSSGEKSLVQICRAMLRKNKIVILDEATANIDIETEQKIQKLIDEEFKGCTMLTIAHRLQTIIKSDKVLVMSYGKVAEYDSPEKLMKNPKSHFTKLVNEIQKQEDEKDLEKKREEALKGDEESEKESDE